MENALVMLVDDEPANLKVLEKMLRGHHTVVSFPRGTLALAAMKAVKPDIVLMDIRMPEMDGYDVCRNMKGNPSLKDIPVIFLSGLSDIRDKITAFEVGGVDYVTKPFSELEILARVQTHLTIRWHALHLDELVQQRTAELAAAHRRLRIWDDAKTHWIHMLAHELRTPLTTVFCATNALFRKVPADDDLDGMREDVQLATGRITKLIDDAITLAKIDDDIKMYKAEKVSLPDVLAEACKHAARYAPDVTFTLPEQLDRSVTTAASPELLRRALSDLLVTAACCTPPRGEVTVLSRLEQNGVVIEIATPGKGLPQDDLDTFFEVGGQRTLLKGGADYGLGPALAHRIVQLSEGDVSVRNGAPAGIVISVRLATGS
jgi:CheY-like chemotaxis protein